MLRAQTPDRPLPPTPTTADHFFRRRPILGLGGRLFLAARLGLGGFGLGLRLGGVGRRLFAFHLLDRLARNKFLLGLGEFEGLALEIVGSATGVGDLL